MPPRDRLCMCKSFSSAVAVIVVATAAGHVVVAIFAARFALGEDLALAVKNARDYLLRGMKNPLRVAGKNFINHLV